MKQKTRKKKGPVRSSQSRTSLSRSLAPEDVRAGRYVAITHVVEQFLWPSPCDGAEWRTPQVREVLWRPYAQRGPLKVVEVCLPFVLARQVDGKFRVLDTRACRLVELSERFGRQAFSRLSDKDKAALDSDVLW
jgi:hypothetical protein